jgi:dUTP pyrophosphatase
MGETMENNKILCKVLENGKLPTKAHDTDAGYDLYCSSDFTIEPGEIIKHPVNIQLQLPTESYAEITSKSGNGSKGLLVYAGIIDESYRGIPHVVAINLSKNQLKFSKGMKLAQMIIHPFRHTTIEEVSDISTETSRSLGGFGSSGGSLV